MSYSKLRIIVVALFIFQFSVVNCFSQTKFGHVDYSEIIKNMKGIDSIQNLIVNFRADQQAIGEEMGKEFKEKQAALEKLANNPNTSQSVLKIRQEELVAMYKRIQDFADSMDAEIRDKQLELLEPFQTALLNAIKKVAKANNYTYVFDITTLMFYASSDDLTNKVKEELGIK